MSNPKCHKVLFDGLNSDKDRLGSNEHWTDRCTPEFYEKPEPDFISKSVMFLALTFACWCLAYGAVMTTIAAVQWLRGM